MFLKQIISSAVITTSLFNLALAAAVVPGTGQVSTLLSEPVRKDVLSDMIADSTVEYGLQRRDVVHRCYDPNPEKGPAPSVDDCNGAIQQLNNRGGDITVNLVEGCYEVWSGNCTGSICPQRWGISTISATVAAQFMADSVITECISKGLRGWYLDRNYGIGVYLS
ncbi:hypothetical protein F4779DRAFT_163645 [Xylariaceae sp. FL0662B]|nr:hypothetical protein F4779DRAFT_163645 [Xylariaceae sp. FL0662B]